MCTGGLDIPTLQISAPKNQGVLLVVVFLVVFRIRKLVVGVQARMINLEHIKISNQY